MQNLSLKQGLLQKLSPQQIQFIKLLQIPTTSLESRIEQELEENPLLEATLDETPTESTKEEYEKNEEPTLYEEKNEEEDFNSEKDGDFSLEDYLRDDDVNGYKMHGDGDNFDDEEKEEYPVAETTTLMDSLYNQLSFQRLNEKEHIIAEQLLGSIDEDGYIRRNLNAIIDDLAFSQDMKTTLVEIEKVLLKIQAFEPAGIAARDLRECLLLQLDRKVEEESVLIAKTIIINHFEEFSKRHYDKIMEILLISENQLKDAIQVITKLNPKPGDTSVAAKTLTVIPDFILNNTNGKIEVSLHSKNAPQLRISHSYSDMIDSYSKSKKKDKNLKEAVIFVKQKLDSAKWFIDAIKQRQITLLKTMNSIVKFQKEFFKEGEDSKLRPMILKDIAEDISMDISTISRVANSKYVQTDFGIYPLKYFFTEAIVTDNGEDASNREVKNILKELVDSENKKNPLSDDKLANMLKEKGFNIARRTIAKYREGQNIAVARLRKMM